MNQYESHWHSMGMTKKPLPIPRSGGKLKQLAPANSYNIIRVALEYGVI